MGLASRSVAAVVSNLRSKYLSILSEEVEAEETEMDGRAEVRLPS